jgi:hypothetical protein
MAMRHLAGFWAGLVVGVVIVAAIESIGHWVYPPPVGIDAGDVQQMTAFIKSLPLGASLLVLVAWFAGAYCGVSLAYKISGKLGIGLVVGVMLFAGAVFTMLQVPHPTWFWVISVAGFPVMVFWGSVSGRMWRDNKSA